MPDKHSDTDEVRQKVIQILEYNVGNEISDEDHRDITNDILQLLTSEKRKLLEKIHRDITVNHHITADEFKKQYLTDWNS